MTDALFEAVYDRPDDDAPRVALADALKKKKDPRGFPVHGFATVFYPHGPRAWRTVRSLVVDIDTRYRYLRLSKFKHLHTLGLDPALVASEPTTRRSRRSCRSSILRARSRALTERRARPRSRAERACARSRTGCAGALR